MNPVSVFYVVLILSLCPYQILSKSSALITKACDRSMYKDLCKSTLQSAPGSNKADLQGLAKITLKSVSSHANQLHDHITKLVEKSSSDKFIQERLKDCAEHYQDAIDEIKDSLAALDAKQYSNVNTWVTSAMTDGESCEEGFMDQPGHKSPLSEMNKVFSQLCSICLSTTNLLAGINN